MPGRVLDSRALLAFFKDEQPAASRIEKIIKDAVRKTTYKVYLSTIGWTELYAELERVGGSDVARRMAEELDQLPIIIVGADDDLKLCRLAARFRASHGLPLAAAFAAAVAQDRRASLVTADPCFSVLSADIRIEWLEEPPASMTHTRLGDPALMAENSHQ